MTRHRSSQLPPDRDNPSVYRRLCQTYMYMQQHAGSQTEGHGDRRTGRHASTQRDIAMYTLYICLSWSCLSIGLALFVKHSQELTLGLRDAVYVFIRFSHGFHGTKNCDDHCVCVCACVSHRSMCTLVQAYNVHVRIIIAYTYIYQCRPICACIGQYDHAKFCIGMQAYMQQLICAFLCVHELVYMYYFSSRNNRPNVIFVV